MPLDLPIALPTLLAALFAAIGCCTLLMPSGSREDN